MAKYVIEDDRNKAGKIETIAKRVQDGDTVIVRSEKTKQEFDRKMFAVGSDHVLYFIEVRAK